MTSRPDDALSELLRAAIRGDEAAYAMFLKSAAVFVRAIARRRVMSGSGIDPEDIVQETLLAVHLKRHTWRPEDPVGPWLGAIVRYKVIDACRKRGGRVEVDIDDVSDHLAAHEEETASERDINRALETLAPGQRKVVSAISLDGKSISDTASLFGMTETAVRVALHRGLAAIAARFGRT